MTRLILASVLSCLPLFAAGCLDPTYTTFKENWNQPAGQPSWSGGPSVACDTWIVTSGSGQSIVSAPYSGFGYPNVLKLPHGASTPTISIIGTIPPIPSGSTTTFSFEFAYSNTTITNFANYVSVGVPGDTALATLNAWTSGGGQFYGTSGTLWAMSAATKHLIVMTIVSGGSSTIKLDGTTVDTFTAPSQGDVQIQFKGDSGASAADLYVGFVGMANSSYPGWAGVAFMDWAGGSGTFTATQGNAGTHCGPSGSVYNGWSYTPGSSTDLMQFAIETTALAAPITVCGSSYAGNSGVSLNHHIPSGANEESLATYKFSSTYALLSVGFYFRDHSAAPATRNRVDAGAWSGGLIFATCWSNSATVCTGTTGSNFLFCVEQIPSGVDIACNAITDNHRYFITFTWTASGNDTLSVYDTNQTTWAVGSLLYTYSPVDAGWSPVGPASLELGATGADAVSTTVDDYYSNVIVETAEGSFPVLPPVGASSGAHGGFIVELSPALSGGRGLGGQ